MKKIIELWNKLYSNKYFIIIKNILFFVFEIGLIVLWFEMDRTKRWLVLTVFLGMNIYMIWKARDFLRMVKSYVDYKVYKAIEESKRKKRNGNAR